MAKTILVALILNGQRSEGARIGPSHPAPSSRRTVDSRSPIEQQPTSRPIAIVVIAFIEAPASHPAS